MTEKTGKNIQRSPRHGWRGESKKKGKVVRFDVDWLALSEERVRGRAALKKRLDRPKKEEDRAFGERPRGRWAT